MGPELARRLERFGQQPALLLPDGHRLSYAELARRADDFAARLGPAAKLVAIAAQRSEHAIVAYLGALRGGHAVAMLPDCRSDHMEAFQARFAPDFTYRQIDGRWRLEESVAPAAAGIHPDLALLLSTSGSTGGSRFVRLSGAAMDANAASIASYQQLTARDRAALILPIHYSYGLSVLNSHLSAGGSIYLPASGAGDGGFAREIGDAGCTNVAGVPYSFELMQRSGFLVRAVGSLRFMSVAGGRLPPALVEAFQRNLSAAGKEFFVMYGQTEATARIAYVPPRLLADNRDSIGIAIPGGSLRLVGNDGCTIEAANVAGQLAYRGPNVMMGYADGRADLARGGEVDELMTGDIAMRDAEGLYRIVGRQKRISKIGGVRIDHQAVEAALDAHGIDAAVAGDDARLVVAYRSGQAHDAVLAKAAAVAGLPALAVRPVAMPEFPRLPNGKIDYRGIAQAAAERPARQDVHRIFRQAFYPRRVGVDDSFETLGGDSLLHVQLALALERDAGRLPAAWPKMPIRELQRIVRPADGLARMPSDFVLRALAILMIVFHHATLWPMPGGAAVLMLLVGFGIAQFHASALFAGDATRLVRSTAMNLAVYAPVVAGYCILRGEILWPSVLLVGDLGLTGPEHMLPYMYWFVEAYAQTVLLVCLLFLIRPVRRAAAADPFAAGMAFLAAAVAAKFLAPLVWPMGALRIFTTPDVLYLAVFGWCAWFARSPRQKVVLITAAVAVLPYMAWWGGNWTGAWVRYGCVLAVVLVLAAAPSLRLPRWVFRLLLPVAAASYHIYLLHRLLPETLWSPAEQAQPIVMVLSIVSGVLVGIAAHRLQHAASGWLLRRRGSPQASLAPGE